jgi:hypothetical protein
MNPFLFDADSDYMFGEEDSYGGQLNLRRFAALNKALTKGMPGAPAGAKQMQAIPPGLRAALGRAAQIEAYRGDDVIYGLDAAAVAAGATSSLSTSPQKRNIPTRLTVSQTVANNFVLSDIRVGVEPVLATTQNLSMAIFVQDSTAPNFRAVVAEVGMDVSVVVTNISGAAARFTATIVGAYLAPSL